MATTSFFSVLNTKFSLLHNCGFCSWFLERCTSVPPSYVVHCFYFHYRFDLDLHFPIVNAYIFAYILLSIVVALCSEHERE